MNIRTDLIDEIKIEAENEILGAETDCYTIGQIKISNVKIKNDNTAKILNKPRGNYCTISFPRLDFICDTDDVVKATVESLKKMCSSNIQSAMVVGLGNIDITPDALGPKVCDRILATRHLTKKLKHDLGLQKLKSVSCISPNVLGKTGIESYDLVCAASDKTNPDIILAIDALAARSPDRLCRTIQIGNTGITAGSGVNNSRKAINFDTIGVPVIAVGIPTVIDANGFFNCDQNMMVTPKEIDLLIEKASDILSRAINIFLQPKIDINVIESLT